MAPRSSPLPRRPSPSAVSVALRLTGSILCSTSVSVWNSVLTSSCTVGGLHLRTGPQRGARWLRRAARTRRTWRRKPLCWRCGRSALDGMKRISLLSIASVSLAWSPAYSMRVDLADLDAAVLHLGVAVHHQTGARRGDRHGVGRCERGRVGQIGEHDGGDKQRSQDRRGDPHVAALGVIRQTFVPRLSGEVEVAGRAVDGE